MGCGTSAPRVSNATKKARPQPVLPSQTVMTVSISPDAEERLKKSFEIITKDIKKVALPANQMTIVCLTGDTFPILVAPIEAAAQTSDDENSELNSEDNNLSNSNHESTRNTISSKNNTNTENNENNIIVDDDSLSLPIIAASYSTSGRLAVYSQLTFLTNAILQIENTMKLVTRTINWLCDGKVEDTPIGIFTKTPEMNETIVHCLKKLNMNPIEDTNISTDLSQSKLIILTSDLDTSNNQLYAKLVEFTLDGGGILVFYNHSSEPSFEINNFLLHYGLSYSYKLIREDEEDVPIINTISDFNKIKLHNFIYLKESITELLDNDDPDLEQLDILITDFRNYMECADERQEQSLLDLANHAWDYLNRTNYSQDNLLCQDIRQCIVMVLILDLYKKIPLRLTMEIPETRIFPGIPGKVNLSHYSKQIELPDVSWVSTGLYLPPGCVGEVKSPDKVPELIVQVGSHSTSLLNENAPWKRWPMITVGFPIVDDVIQIGSQFGGIVYISSEDGNIEGIDLDFDGFSEYPLYSSKDPSIWEKTKDLEVPIAEIETNSLIFTLPTIYMKKYDLPKICERFDKLHHIMINFLSAPLLHQDRIVFDIEAPRENKYCGYPIFEDLERIDQLFSNLDKPNFPLFNELIRIATCDIRENCFDNGIERAFATVAACLAFKEVYPDFDPYMFRHEMKVPCLFSEFWKIVQKGDKDWISKALSKFQDPSYILSNVPEDTWIAFVRELCIVGKHDFTEFLDKVYPIPLNSAYNQLSLPKFQS
ncbi:hypothetical protein TRFO_37534 [Tritrichomonas foetus]|uniref:Peptidase M60 domain-containing protein n=1 Tax=Tritrichomonas foetus TaxID=1144522 RepID=A0A1J4JGG0_9EUKA|nr:hypothetical protein TRFO_37534 [Tritrichomonas foetus]|eukprot:OHS96292.1 hypothetical protein TRFO_37534 [Tritrichomonas foetus]